MLTLSCLTLWTAALLFSCAQALPATSASSSSYPAYTAPGSGDVRGPCPGLNSLANHNIIPHSGKGNTIPILVAGLATGLNVGADFATAIGLAGSLSNPNFNPLSPQFDLNHLDEHNFPIEHDASLSRQDFYFGDDHSFNQSIWNMILSHIPANSPFTIPPAAAARYARVTTENGRDPKFTYTPQQFVLSYGETALYLSTMGDPVTGIAPYSYVQSLFEKETLPYALGWRTPKTQTNLASLAAMTVKLMSSTPQDSLPEGLVLTESTLKVAFEGGNPVTGVIPAGLQGILGN